MKPSGMSLVSLENYRSKKMGFKLVTERLLEWLHISVTLSLKAVPINQKGDQAVHIYSLNR